MTDVQRPDGQPAQGRPLPPPPPSARPAFDLLGGSHRQQGGPAPAPDPKAPAGGGSPVQAVLRIGALIGLLVLLGVLGSWWAVIVVVALIVMIALHELGHYLAAKRAGMKVTEFFIGFGPRIWSVRRGEVEYGVKAIPAGAYVKIIGMSNLEQVDPAEEARTYRAKPYWSRFCVAVAGSAMHFALALVLLFGVFFLTGAPKEDNWVVGALTPNSPATQVGLLLGDDVQQVNGVEIVTYADFREEIRKYPGEEVTLVVERDGQLLTLTPTLDVKETDDGSSVGFLGIGPEYPYEREPIGQAVVSTFEGFGEITWQSVSGLVRVFSLDGMQNYFDNLTSSGEPSGSGSGSGSGTSDDRLVSPIGAVSIGAQLASNGMADLLFFLAAVNIFVGLFNLVPLPPFDGGHIAIATYEEIRSRRQGRRYYADVTKLMPIAYLVVGILLVLFVGNLYLDITNPVKL